MSGAAKSSTENEPTTIEPQSQVVRTRFRLERKLGTGGMGTVWLARDTTLQRWVALKSIRPDLCGNDGFRRRMERECLLHAQVGAHANIVTLYDIIEDASEIHLVMEYVEGQTLHQRLEQCASDETPMPWNEAVTIVSQTLAALARIHEHGIVHRDIKPANIMLARERDGSVCAKLTDFGVARSDINDQKLTQLTSSGSVSPGTPLYMSPEQIDSRTYGDVSPCSDIYAMGVVLYQAISGHVPFEGTLTEVLNGHLNSTPPPLVLPAGDALPRRLVAAANKAMSKKSDQRYQTARQFKSDLDRVLHDDAPQAETIAGSAPPGVVTEKPAKARPPRRPVMAMVAGGLVLCLLAIGGLAISMLGGSPDSPGTTAVTNTREPDTVGQQRTWEEAESPDVMATADPDTPPAVAAPDINQTGFLAAVAYDVDAAAWPASDLTLDGVEIQEPGEVAMEGQTYVVQPGDTISKIAAAYSVEPVVLCQWNNLREPTSLGIGQTLYLYERPGIEMPRRDQINMAGPVKPKAVVQEPAPEPVAVQPAAPIVANEPAPAPEPEKKGIRARIRTFLQGDGDGKKDVHERNGSQLRDN